MLNEEKEKEGFKLVSVKNSIWKILKIESAEQETTIGDVVEQLVLGNMNDDSYLKLKEVKDKNE